MGEQIPFRALAVALFVGAIVGGATWCGVYRAEAEDSAKRIYGRQVAPIIAKCAVCHSGEEPLGGLDMASREALLRGGDSGPALIVGQSRKSAIWKRSEDGSMPPINDAPRLSPAEVAALAQWIEAGAEWPADETTTSARRPRRGFLRRRWRRP